MAKRAKRERASPAPKAPEEQNTLVFTGRIYPERAACFFQNIPPHLFGPDPSHLSRIDLFVFGSQILVRVTGGFDTADIDTLKNSVKIFASIFTDALGWETGYGYTVEITTCTSPQDQFVFGVDIPILVDSPVQPPAESRSILPLLLDDPDGKLRPLRRALADFRQAILAPDDTPFYCFRAVEALTFYFHPRDRKRGRSMLCKKLRIDDKWVIKKLEIPAGAIRHGRVVPVGDEDRKLAFLSARAVIERFITLVHGGLAELPEAEFPQLRLD
jgi:hypothetical protein